jgi:WD40 repeat protein
MRGSGNAIEDSAWSPDGMHIASVYVTGMSYGVEIWNALSGAHQFTLSCSNTMAYGIRDVTWSPDGKYVAAVAPGGDGICVWKASDGSVVTRIAGGASQVTFSANSQELAFNQGSSVQIYDLASGKVIHSFPVQDTKGELFSLAWSPDGKYLAAAGHDLHLLNANTGSIVATYHAAMGTWMENLAWSPDNTMIAGESYILDNPTAYVSAWHVK